MTISVLPELMHNKDFKYKVRRPDWPKDEFIFGSEIKIVSKKDIEENILFDDGTSDLFTDDLDVVIHRIIFHHSIHTDSNGIKRHLIKQWSPRHDDLINGEIPWEIMSMVNEELDDVKKAESKL